MDNLLQQAIEHCAAECPNEPYINDIVDQVAFARLKLSVTDPGNQVDGLSAGVGRRASREVNEFLWPGFDLRKIPNKDSA